MVWPASILANRRTERLIGRERKDTISIGIRMISIGSGTLGAKIEKKRKPWRAMPTTITIRNTKNASAKGAMMWLVTGKGWTLGKIANGNRPRKFENSTNMKSVKTKGKNFSP